MSTVLQEGIASCLKERAKTVQFFNRNAYTKHGIPYDMDTPDATIRHTHEHTGLTAPQPVPTPQPTSQSGLPTWAKYGLAGVLGAAAGSPLVWLASDLTKPEPSTVITPIEKHTEHTEHKSTIQELPVDPTLLYLENEGFAVPPAEKK